MTDTLANPDGLSSTARFKTESQPTEHWEAGYLAFFHGAESSANPYPVPGFRAGEWESGWSAALKEFEAAGETEFDIDLGEPIA